MALSSIPARNASLDNDYGDGHGDAAPTAFQLALFHGDPDNGGTELDVDGGYVRPVLANTTANFPDAVDGLKTVPVDLADATDAYSDTITHWQLYDDADGVTAWDSGQFANEISVDTARPVSVVCTIYYGDLA